MFLRRPGFVAIIFFLVSLFLVPVSAVRSFPNRVAFDGEKSRIQSDTCMKFFEAPEYQNGQECTNLAENGQLFVCQPSVVHIAMTLDPEYLRGTIAAVHSVLKHASCPENIFFHFIASDSGSTKADDLKQIVRSAFPSLRFKVYVFQVNLVTDLISSSIRHALDNPLNYARSYLAELLEPCVKRVIYLDSDIIVVDDIQKLWTISLTGTRTIGAPEYCHVNFTKYFSNEFWFDRELSRVFEGKKPCYFNTGVMVIDLVGWNEGESTTKIEKWMRVQRERRIYELGSLPPFLLVFGGDVEPIHHRWNQHGLGGDNVVNSCRSLHAGSVSLMHWSGKGKPWTRLDSKKPCPVDYLWAPYDLYKFRGQSPQ